MIWVVAVRPGSQRIYKAYQRPMATSNKAIQEALFELASRTHFLHFSLQHHCRCLPSSQPRTASTISPWTNLFLPTTTSNFLSTANHPQPTSISHLLCIISSTHSSHLLCIISSNHYSHPLHPFSSNFWQHISATHHHPLQSPPLAYHNNKNSFI